MKLPLAKKLNAEKYVAGLSLFKQKMARIKLSANECALGPSPKATKEYLKVSKNFKNVEILWASTREPYNYIQARQLGCHIITVPPSIIEKIEKFGKSFQKLTTGTVKSFLIDSKKSRFKI